MPLACPAFIAAIDPELCRSIDQYCERTGPNWDAEPINALTNLAFFLAGWLAWRHFVRIPDARRDRLLVLIVAVIPVVGAGSFLFHTLAMRWAEWIDVIPILVFMLLYLWLVATRFFRWPLPLRILALGIFCAVTFALEAAVPGDVLWGGAMYLPTLVTLVAVGILAPHLEAQARRSLLFAAGLFLVSYTMRSLDQPLCASLPFGTHFLWHLFNALLLYLLVRVAIVQSAQGGYRQR